MAVSQIELIKSLPPAVSIEVLLDQQAKARQIEITPELIKELGYDPRKISETEWEERVSAAGWD